MPAVQGEHVVAPGPAANVPAAHAVHTFTPADAAAEPAGQRVHVPAAVWSKYRPAGHEMVPDMVIVDAAALLPSVQPVPVAERPTTKQTAAPLFIEAGAVKVRTWFDVDRAAVGGVAAVHATVGVPV